MIARDWRGDPVGRTDHVALDLELDGRRLALRVDAPYHGDPAPLQPPGRCERLWEHEVVELFLLGDDGRYTELELGPHGHYLALRLHGVRQLLDDRLAMQFDARREGGRWRGEASIERHALPETLRAGNAYAIHGEGARRVHLALHPVPGAEPDFHRPECFEPLPWR